MPQARFLVGGRILRRMGPVWLAGLALVAGCARQPEAAPAAAGTSGAATTREERHALTGEVLKVDTARGQLIVQHDEIKGYMPAMTMEFAVSPGDLALAKPGQRIRAEMVSRPGEDLRLEKIWPADRAVADAVNLGALQLRQDTHTRGKGAYREVGEVVPDFALYDQTGRVVQASRFRGKQLLINFIFTRCPIATMCPAATAKMVTVQRLAREAGVPNLELISITLDPAHDTPGVLREYAETRGIDSANFSLLTGPETAIRDLLTQFGVIAELEGELIKHTLATLLVDANGRIVHRVDGSLWEAADFVSRMRK